MTYQSGTGLSPGPWPSLSILENKIVPESRGETMPKDSVNLYLSIQSGSSERTLISLADKTSALNKEYQLLEQASEGLARANKPLLEQQTKLQSELRASQKVVNDLQKAYDEYGDEMMKLDLDQAIENHSKLKSELSEVNAQLGANQKTYKEYLEAVRKGSLSDPGVNLDRGSDALSSVGEVLGGLGVGQMMSNLVEQGGGALLSSALGSDMGGMVSNALSSAISGAALGTAILPGIGTAIGTFFGGVSGLVSGSMEQQEHLDDAFKEYYGGLYEDVSARSGEMVESGSTIAGGREQTRMAFSQRLGGDEQADAYLAQVEKMAAGTNYEYDEIVGYTKLLLNSYDPDEVFGVLQKLSDATAGLDLSSSDVNMMISGLSRMRTTGKATQEYLNYFRERGVDTDQALAEALTESTGKTVQKSAIADMVHDGDISGEFAAQAILDFIQQEFGGLSDTLAGTYDAMVDNLGDINASLEARGGDAYNELRKEGVDAEMNALSGELGDAIGEINVIMGENQARKENMQEQYVREALEAVLLGKEGSVFNEEENATLAEMSAQYAELKARYDESGGTDAEAGAQMEALYEEAQALGQSYFDNSEFMQMLTETEIDEIQAIRDNTTWLENATTAAYKVEQALSKGYGGITVSVEGLSNARVTASENTLNSSQARRYGSSANKNKTGRSRYAFGLDRVPYDEYPALLHEGERVLTASQARAQDTGQAGASPIQITITGNSFTGTPEEMADQLAEILARKISQAATAAAPK